MTICNQANYECQANEQKEEESKVRQQHDQTHDEDLRPSLDGAGYANTYGNDVYGKLVVEEADGQLRFSFGSLFRGQLQHHRNDSFDAVHDDARRNASEPIIVSFALNASGESEQVLLEVFGEESTLIRFIAVPKEEDAKIPTGSDDQPWLCDTQGHLTTRHYVGMFDESHMHFFAEFGAELETMR